LPDERFKFVFRNTGLAHINNFILLYQVFAAFYILSNVART
jgi:hypothetical protein